MAPRITFTSYADENRPEVEPSAELLRAGGVRVFIDVAGIAYGDRWPASALALGVSTAAWFLRADSKLPVAAVSGPSPVAPAPAASAAAVPALTGPGNDKLRISSAKNPILKVMCALLLEAGLVPTQPESNQAAIEDLRAQLANAFSPANLKLVDREDLLALAVAATDSRQALKDIQALLKSGQVRFKTPGEQHAFESLRVELERVGAAINQARSELDRPVPPPAPVPLPAASSASATPASAPSLQPTTQAEPAADFGALQLAIPIGLGLLFCAVGAGVRLRRGKRGSRRAEAADYVARVFGA